MLKPLLKIIATHQAGVQLKANIERRSVYSRARETANSLDMPMLVVGGPRGGWYRALKIPAHGCGDVCLDIELGQCSICGAEVELIEADVRDIPYPDLHFGSAYASHVLEHLPTVDDALQAVNELYRVAHHVFIVSPSKQDIVAWLHPQHHLWVKQDQAGIILEQRGVL